MEEKTRASATVLGAKAGLDQVDWISLTKSGKGGSVLLCTGVAEGNQEPWGSLCLGHSTPRHQAALTTRASTEVLEMPPVPAAASPARTSLLYDLLVTRSLQREDVLLVVSDGLRLKLRLRLKSRSGQPGDRRSCGTPAQLWHQRLIACPS
ncbi:hypothetical protein EOD39_16784 [Acipenser ruthenus]|uniref:Uncharacterized protein n=1 Tax=Acipenser ruthenus TaxID=7906 RepID=A0A444V535_ACIRT|nr:hypothetical protein EOD39_16784 [Acipenser ruthenus]